MAFKPLTYAAWRDRRLELETCPWAGPRPLREDDVKQFVGREGDVSAFVSDVFEHSLVILEAASGVGKSSLLSVGLMGELRNRGYETFYCDRWVLSADDPIAVDPSPDDYLASLFAGAVDLEPDEKFADAIDRQFGSRAVLILDQFEELIRYDEDFFRRVCAWLLDAVGRTDIKVVVSLRSEYAHRLRELERRIGPWGMSRSILQPICDEKAIEELLRAPAADPKCTVRLNESGEAAILKLWRTHDLAELPTGMLRLHSLLFALHGRLESGNGIISENEVDTFVKESARIGTAVFDAAMAETVRLKMKLCEDALGQAGRVDPYLRHGTRQVVQETARHLSSGGYKLVRERWDLAQRALDRELDVLGLVSSERSRTLERDASLADVGFRRFSELAAGSTENDPDFLTATWDEIVGVEALAQIKTTGQPWEVDLEELSSGAMLGMAPELVLLEEYRRFTFALKWLEDSSLVRITGTQDKRSMISLVHDGFGVALEGWIDELEAQPADAICRLTASKGDTHDWRRAEGKPPWPDLVDAEIVNVRWRDGLIKAKFCRVTFLNCDLRGSLFEHCSFEGVQFLNCILDGVTLTECDIIGSVPPFAEAYPKGVPPSFEVSPRNDGAVEVLLRYRGSRGRDEQPRSLISHTSGMPAVPLTLEHESVFPDKLTDGMPWRITVPSADGGISMYGGRLSSLTVRRCQFQDGEFGLRLVSGTALDIVECVDGKIRLDIYGSAIRGLTVTGPAGDTEARPVTVDVRVNDAVMAASWLGPGLVGRAQFVNALVWQLLSLADRAELVVEFADCGYFGLVNVGRPSDGTPLDNEFDIEAVQDPEEKASVAARMDYQSDPAEAEFRRRAGKNVWPPVVAVAATRGG